MPENPPTVSRSEAGDNTLKGYHPGETKGRSELAYCYATAADFAEMTPEAYAAAQKMKTVYHHGKGDLSPGHDVAIHLCRVRPQGASTAGCRPSSHSGTVCPTARS